LWNLGKHPRKVLEMKPITVWLCFAVLIVVLVGCRDNHDTDAFYTSRTDATKSGEFDRGWLPEFLPESTHAIHIAYDLSPSKVWCAFGFNPADSEKLVNNLQPVDPQKIAISQIPSPHVKWWPQHLSGKLDVQKIQGTGLTLYSTSKPLSPAESETLLFAIDHNGRGFFYGR
jgi:hypothetical protein